MSPESTFFFYGTLMVPAILHRVIHGSSNPEPWQKALLTTRPALLPGYRRYRVRDADYPALMEIPPHVRTRGGGGGGGGQAGVLGVVVTGLTEGDVYRLDRFEGSEYEKRVVRVRVFRNTESDTIVANGKERGDDSLRRALERTAGCYGQNEHDQAEEDMEEVVATTYVWIAPRERLDLAREWDFEHFKREKLQWWIEADESEL